jgi:hypothetical protein
VRVVVDGKQARLSDLKVGKSVVLRLDRDGKTVQAISVISIRRPLQFFSGVVSEVKDKKLTVSIGRRGSEIEKSFDVGESVRVLVDGKLAKLADLAKGMMVQVGQDDKEVLITVRAEGPSVSGKVKEITTEKITLQGRREETSYRVSPNAMVIIERKPGKLADVKTDMEVMLKLSVDGKTVLTIHRIEVRRVSPRERVVGKIQALDAKGRTITLTDLRGAGAKEFKIAGNVVVSVDGKRKPGALEEIKVGSMAVLMLSADNLVELIEVRTVKPPREDGRREGDRR